MKNQSYHPNFFKQLLLYIIFCILFFITYSSFISLGIFFHFLIGHHIYTIRDWSLNYLWPMIIFVKCIVFFLFTYFLKMRDASFQGLLIFFKQKCQKPRKNIFVILIFLTMNLFLYLKPVSIHQAFFLSQYFMLALSYMGIVFFYGIDFLLILYIKHFFPIPSDQETPYSKNLLHLFLFPVIFYGSFKFSIPLGHKIDYLVIFHTFLSFHFLNFKGKELTFFCLYHLLFVAPLCSFWGLDPLLGSQFSPYKMEKELPFYICLVLWPTMYFYLNYTEQLKQNK